ncbi:unnamed protein product [Lactuca virosa]|uniref:Uncharacterized protein n=1 Tax=Lactuca virosa TaxID=75947 RepID=A0AAU9LIL9_9ASTR|nr:unnamed protein product [Lactuca virosa]
MYNRTSNGFSSLSSNHQEPQKLRFMGYHHRRNQQHQQAFAFQLAQKGLHLILGSRNLSKLKEVYDEIVSVHPTTKIKIFTVDFSDENMVVGVR